MEKEEPTLKKAKTIPSADKVRGFSWNNFYRLIPKRKIDQRQVLCELTEGSSMKTAVKTITI